MSRCTAAAVGLVITIWASCPKAFSGTIRHDVSPGAYISLAQELPYMSVGLIETTVRGGKGYIGSGTLIDSEWVLTAAHMLDRVTNLTFTINDKPYVASAWVSYSTWHGDLFAGDDIALVKLSEAVDGVTPALRLTESFELGTAATFVGYGMTGTGLSGATTFDWQKRAGQNALDATMAGGNILLADFDSPLNASESRYGSSTPLALEYLIAPGDSGGGVFIDNMLVAVNSFIMAWDRKTDSDYGDAAGVTSVLPFNAWIDDILANGIGSKPPGGGGGKKPKASELGGEMLGGELYSAEVPEPASLSLLAAGTLALVARRRRRRA